MIALGIDIGGASIKLAAIDASGAAICLQSPQYTRPTRDQLIASIRNTLGRRATDTLTAVGVCVPGLFDRAARRVTASVNVPGLVDVPLDDLANEACGFSGSIALANDAVATAYDIYYQNPVPGRLLVLALGTGVGAALLDDGVPLMVEGESPGHLGQIDVSLDGQPPVGPDGGAGGLEAYIGSPAVAQRYGSDVLGLAIDRMGADELPVRAPVRCLRIAHALYRPERICLAGGIGLRLRRLLPTIHEQVNCQLTSVARPGWTLFCAADEFHAARGMASHALRSAG